MSSILVTFLRSVVAVDSACIDVRLLLPDFAPMLQIWVHFAFDLVLRIALVLYVNLDW